MNNLKDGCTTVHIGTYEAASVALPKEPGPKGLKARLEKSKGKPPVNGKTKKEKV